MPPQNKRFFSSTDFSKSHYTFRYMEQSHKNISRLNFSLYPWNIFTLKWCSTQFHHERTTVRSNISKSMAEKWLTINVFRWSSTNQVFVPPWQEEKALVFSWHCVQNQASPNQNCLSPTGGSSSLNWSDFETLAHRVGKPNPLNEEGFWFESAAMMNLKWNATFTPKIPGSLLLLVHKQLAEHTSTVLKQPDLSQTQVKLVVAEKSQTKISVQWIDHRKWIIFLSKQESLFFWESFLFLLTYLIKLQTKINFWVTQIWTFSDQKILLDKGNIVDFNFTTDSKVWTKTQHVREK